MRTHVAILFRDPVIAQQEKQDIILASGIDPDSWTFFNATDGLFPVRADLEHVTHLVLGGGQVRLSQAEPTWFGPVCRLVEHGLSRGVRVFGICLGMQLVSRIYGARVEEGCGEFGAIQVTMSDGSGTVFDGRPNFAANTAHRDWVPGVPAGLRVIGSSEACPHQIMVGNDGQVTLTQFHPERGQKSFSSMTKHYIIPDPVNGWVKNDPWPLRSFLEPQVSVLHQ